MISPNSFRVWELWMANCGVQVVLSHTSHTSHGEATSQISGLERPRGYMHHTASLWYSQQRNSISSLIEFPPLIFFYVLEWSLSLVPLFSTSATFGVPRAYFRGWYGHTPESCWATKRPVNSVYLLTYLPTVAGWHKNSFGRWLG